MATGNAQIVENIETEIQHCTKYYLLRSQLC